jgi:L-rhamnose-H+ transport protein
MAYGTNTIEAARRLGANPALVGNAVWCIFFTFGGLVNIVYCVALMIRRRNFRKIFSEEVLCNYAWASVMALMWIGSFYLYGIGALIMGNWGAVVGWPVFISLSIGVGVLCGWWKGEWRNAPASANRLLWQGLLLIFLGVLVIPFANVSASPERKNDGRRRMRAPITHETDRPSNERGKTLMCLEVALSPWWQP